MELQGNVALVTGAGSGIGRATALRLARDGAIVGVLSRTREEVESTAREIKEMGAEAIALTADISDAGQIQAAVRLLVDEYGRLDIVFANAGINGVWAPIDELQPEEWDRTININLRGTFLTLHYTVPHLKKAGGGSIIIPHPSMERGRSPPPERLPIPARRPHRSRWPKCWPSSSPNTRYGSM